MLMSKLHKVSLMSDGSQEIKMFLTSQLEDFDIVNQPFRNPIVRVRGRNKKKKKRHFQEEMWSGIIKYIQNKKY